MKILFSVVLMLGFISEVQAKSRLESFPLMSATGSVKMNGDVQLIKMCASTMSLGMNCDCEKIALVNPNAIISIFDWKGKTYVSLVGNTHACLPMSMTDLVKELEKNQEKK